MENINLCSAQGCKKEGKMRCPDCLKYKIKEGSYFCGKDCFKASWASHKAIHAECTYNNNCFKYIINW